MEVKIKAKPKSLYIKVGTRFPVLGRLIRRVYFRILVNTVRKQVSGKHNTIHYDNCTLSSVLFDIKGNNIEIKNNCYLKGVTFYIRGDDHNITIGEKCRLGQGSILWFEDTKCSLSIGDGSTFESVHIAVTEPGSKIMIGKDCMFANDIDVRTGDSHSILSSESGERLNYASDIHIGDHVWIAAHSILLKGVGIQENSVVATGSVVTREFKDKGILIAGNPASVVKSQITWTGQRIYT